MENLQSKTIAERIIKEDGLNETTVNAIQLVQEEFETYKTKKND